MPSAAGEFGALSEVVEANLDRFEQSRLMYGHMVRVVDVASDLGKYVIYSVVRNSHCVS
jgi:hypothetical protein